MTISSSRSNAPVRCSSDRITFTRASSVSAVARPATLAVQSHRYFWPGCTSRALPFSFERPDVDLGETKREKELLGPIAQLARAHP